MYHEAATVVTDPVRIDDLQVGNVIVVGGVEREVIALPDTYPVGGVEQHRIPLKPVQAMPGYWYAPLGSTVLRTRRSPR